METQTSAFQSLDALNPSTFVQQKRELEILHAIIQAVTNSTNLDTTLQTALDIVLSVVGSKTGWICLMEADDTCSAFVGHSGLCFPGRSPEEGPPPCLVQCVCERVRRTQDVVVIRSLAPGCPLLPADGQPAQAIHGHISVPLMIKSRIVGQLNVAFDHPQQADSLDIGLLKSIAPHLAVAVENARLWAEVQEKEELRKELLKKVVNAQEDERRRISRELHDELGQEMTSLLVRLEVVEKLEECHQIDTLHGIKNTVAGMLSSIHDLALELRPTALDDLGLEAALAQYCRSAPAYLGIEVDFEAVGIGGQRLSREIETTLYRVIQESLTNVARHSGAAKASVLLKMQDQQIVAIIEDSGVGFDLRDVKTAQLKKNRLGLYGMEERAALVGGTLTVESRTGVGTTIYVKVPLT